MRSRILTVAAALACLWASTALGASSSGPSDDGTALSLAPGSEVAQSPSGILDPTFRSGELAEFLWEPPAITVPFSFGSGKITAIGLVSDVLSAPGMAGQQNWYLRDIAVSAELAPGVNFNLAQGRDLAAMGAFGGGADFNSGMFLTSSGWRMPYLSLTDGGTYAGLTLDLADGLQLRIGSASLGGQAAGRENLLANAGLQALPPDLALQLASNGRNAETAAIGFDWNFADWGALGVTASQTRESNTLLGNVTANSFAVADAVQTAALGISARVGFGAGWVTTVSYSQGLSKLDLRPNGYFTGANTLKSRAYGISIAKQGIFGDDTLGLALSRPLQVYGAGSGFVSGAGFSPDGDLLLGSEGRGFANGAPESDIELGYVTSFLGGTLALQANAAYQLNAGGQKGQNAVTVVSRAKINF